MSRSALAMPTRPSVTHAPAVRKLAPLAKVLASVRAKIREDLFRFRTCCADPRASK